MAALGPHKRDFEVLVITLLVLATLIASMFTRAGHTRSRCSNVGTKAADHLIGTSRKDVLCGLLGSDLIRGVAGVDSISAVDGGRYDTLDAGAGDDYCLVDLHDTVLNCEHTTQI